MLDVSLRRGGEGRGGEVEGRGGEGRGGEGRGGEGRGGEGRGGEGRGGELECNSLLQRRPISFQSHRMESGLTSACMTSSLTLTIRLPSMMMPMEEERVVLMSSRRTCSLVLS